MVKLISFMVLSTLIIAPAFASELWNIETRDVAKPHLFGRDMEGLFAREQDFELPTLARRFLLNWSGEVKPREVELEGLLRRDGAAENVVETRSFTPQQLAAHPPFGKHEFVGRDFDDELIERDFDHELHVRVVLDDDDLYERFYDDLD